MGGETTRSLTLARRLATRTNFFRFWRMLYSCHIYLVSFVFGTKSDAVFSRDKAPRSLTLARRLAARTHFLSLWRFSYSRHIDLQWVYWTLDSYHIYVLYMSLVPPGHCPQSSLLSSVGAVLRMWKVHLRPTHVFSMGLSPWEIDRFDPLPVIFMSWLQRKGTNRVFRKDNGFDRISIWRVLRVLLLWTNTTFLTFCCSKGLTSFDNKSVCSIYCLV